MEITIRFSKEHRRILTAMYNGLKLELMQSTKNCMKDGFALVGDGNSLRGFSEVLSSSVIFLQDKKFLDFNGKTGQYFITTAGKVKIGVEKKKTKAKKKAKEGA